MNIVSRLLYLSGIAIACSVIHHSIHWVLTGMFWWTDQYMQVSVPYLAQVGSIKYFLIAIIDQFTVFAVPAFLVVSGFFIAFSSSKTQLLSERWKLVINRIKFLLIPYLIWSAVIILYFVLQGERYSVLEIGRLVVSGKLLAPFYYVPLIIQLYLLSPLLLPIARRHYKLLLLIAVLLQIPVTIGTYALILNPQLEESGLFFTIFVDWYVPGYIFWFVLGMVGGLHFTEFKQFLIRYRTLWVTLLVVTFVGGMVEWVYIRQLSGKEWLSHQILIINKLYFFAIIMCFLSFTDIKLPIKSRMEKLGSKSYGIYLIHGLFLEITARAIYHIAPWIFQFELLFLLVLFIVGLGVPLLGMEIVKRSRFVGYYKYVFG